MVVTRLPDEIYAAPRTWARRPSEMVYYNKFPEGHTLRCVGAARVYGDCAA
jgi:hypothetical protein